MDFIHLNALSLHSITGWVVSSSQSGYWMSLSCNSLLSCLANCTSITSVIKPLLSFQVASSIALYYLHFCLLQASHWHRCHLQASHCRWWTSPGSSGIVGIECLCLLLGCNTAGCGVAVPGIGRNSSSQSSRDSHPKLSSNEPLSVSSIHHWFLHHTGRPVRPAWLAATKTGKQKLHMPFAGKLEPAQNTRQTQQSLSCGQMCCRCTYSILQKTTSSMICSPNFTFTVFLFNHRNFSIYLITKIIQSI